MARAALFISAMAAPCPAMAQQARLGNLINYPFGTLTVTSDQSRSDDVCVYSSTATRSYTVLASGDGAGGAFTMASGGSTLAYELEWIDTPGQTSGIPLTAGTTSRSFTTTSTQPNSCNGSLTASMTIRVRLAQMVLAQAGSYSGTLSITITPQ